MATPNATQRAILESIPQLTQDDLDAYGKLGSSNFLFPQIEGNSVSQRPTVDLPHDLNGCQAPRYSPYGFGDVPAYSYVLRFTMIRDDDPYGQGIPSGTVGYWTHDGDGCHIDSQNQIHGIRWVGHNTSLAITSDQEWAVELLLFGAFCGWPNNWDPFYNGYVNAILNTVWISWKNNGAVARSTETPTAMLDYTCGSWRTRGSVSSPGGSADEWVISNVMWGTVIEKIWTQSINGLKPMFNDGSLENVDQRRGLKIAARRLSHDFQEEIHARSSYHLTGYDPLACVINRLK